MTDLHRVLWVAAAVEMTMHFKCCNREKRPPPPCSNVRASIFTSWSPDSCMRLEITSLFPVGRPLDFRFAAEVPTQTAAVCLRTSPSRPISNASWNWQNNVDASWLYQIFACRRWPQPNWSDEQTVRILEFGSGFFTGRIMRSGSIHQTGWRYLITVVVTCGVLNDIRNFAWFHCADRVATNARYFR